MVPLFFFSKLFENHAAKVDIVDCNMDHVLAIMHDKSEDLIDSMERNIKSELYKVRHSEDTKTLNAAMESVLKCLDALQKQYRKYAKTTKKKAKIHPSHVIQEAETTRDALCHILGFYPSKAVQAALHSAPIWPALNEDETQMMMLIIEQDKKAKKGNWALETAMEDSGMCQRARDELAAKIAYDDLQSKLGDTFKDKKVEEEEEEADVKVGESIDGVDGATAVDNDEATEQQLDGDGNVIEPEEGDEDNEEEADEDDEDDGENEDDDNDEEDDDDEDDAEEEEGNGEEEKSTGVEMEKKKAKKKEKKQEKNEGLPNPTVVHSSFIGYKPRRPRDLFPTPPLNDSAPPVPQYAMNGLSILYPKVVRF